MKTLFARFAAVALLGGIASLAAADDKSTETGKKADAGTKADSAELAALQKKLLGEWWGGPCRGDYTFNADGTYVCTHYSPGRNTLSGIWKVRWDSLPPTIVITCLETDFKKKYGKDEEYPYLGKPLEGKVKLLDDVRAIVDFDEWEDMWERPDERTGKKAADDREKAKAEAAAPLTEAKAIEVGLTAMKAKFPTDHVDKFKPYRAKLADGVWSVVGTVPGGGPGGTPMAEIRHSDAVVVKVVHGQ